jgi:hypothetical protein
MNSSIKGLLDVTHHFWHVTCCYAPHARGNHNMKRLWQRPLTRELVIILVVKVVLIVSIKIVFFSEPAKPGSEGTAKALLAPVGIHNTQGNAIHE